MGLRTLSRKFVYLARSSLTLEGAKYKLQTICSIPRYLNYPSFCMALTIDSQFIYNHRRSQQMSEPYTYGQ